MGDTFCFTGPTLDDVMRDAIEIVLSVGEYTSPSRGPALELRGVVLTIENPRARLSRTETRGKVFSSIGELCWYLAASNDLSFIEYYLKKYRDSADGDAIHGGYGPRLFNWDGRNQISSISELLREKTDTRKAVVQLFDARDLDCEYNDVPCTCLLQFFSRDGRLDLIVYMRSNDAYKGLPHDVFAFTMLQELLARDLDLDVGRYKHMVGSFHLYDEDRARAEAFIGEGFQPTNTVMPAMPSGSPWPSVAMLLSAERQLRVGGQLEEAWPEDLDPYWGDLILLLQGFRFDKDGERERIPELLKRISTPAYVPYLQARAER